MSGRTRRAAWFDSLALNERARTRPKHLAFSSAQA
jgi:hypothetical protein